VHHSEATHVALMTIVSRSISGNIPDMEKTHLFVMIHDKSEGGLYGRAITGSRAGCDYLYSTVTFPILE
ncbi:MAG TPA: hypothetical protein VL126_00580, partial [Bacteroidota bacterium]|nr:hypothetical protein [Bacteroidota bacterium]